MVNPAIAILAIPLIVWLIKGLFIGGTFGFAAIFASPLLIWVIIIWVAVLFLRRK